MGKVIIQKKWTATTSYGEVCYTPDHTSSRSGFLWDLRKALCAHPYLQQDHSRAWAGRFNSTWGKAQ